MNKKSDKNDNINVPKKPMEQENRATQQICNGLIIFCEVIVMLFKMIVEILMGVFRKFVPAEEKSVKGEIVLITGCGHGIGRELAFQYAALGATVVGWDLNLETNEQTMKDIVAMGGPKGHAFQCDVTSREQILELAKKVQKEVGDVSILVNNAGIMPCHPLNEHSEQEIRKIFEINVFAHFWMLEAFMPSMLKRNHGHIVALSSMAGISGLRNLVPYCASKYAVRGLMEAISEEIRESTPGNQVKFTTICPYMVDTGLCKNPKVRFPSLIPMLTPKNVAKYIVSAQRRNIDDTTIPGYMLPLNYVFRLLPLNCGRMIKDFMDCGVESDKF